MTSGTTTDTKRGTDEEKPVVLAVDDEERVVQAFELWLGSGYDVRTATGGEEALEQFDETVDVVLLDRHMPGMSGDEVLEEIRERDSGVRVAMVTGVDPDFDIVDMPFEEYVQKPLDSGELQAVVDRLLQLESYDTRFDELYSVTQKLATLESEKPEQVLDESDQYAALTDRKEKLQAELESLTDTMGDEEFQSLFRETTS